MKVVTLLGLAPCMLAAVVSAAFAVDLKRYPVGTEITDVATARKLLAQDAARPVRKWRELTPADIPAGRDGDQIRYGASLLTNTSRLIGPRVDNKQMRFSRNDLNCVGCHQAGPSGLPGTKKFSLPLFNAAHDYPKLNIKSAKVTSLQMVVAGMFGAGEAKIDPEGAEMKAIVAYIGWLGKGNPAGARVTGTGLNETVLLPRRPADPLRGKALYQSTCVACHGAQGLGMKNAGFDSGHGYAIPPIAGPDSYDDGGHMYMVPLLTRFLYANMPLGASADAPKLSIAEAYDIAAFVNSALPRKRNAGRAAMYPLAALRPAGFVIPEHFNGDESYYQTARFGPFAQSKQSIPRGVVN